METLTLPPLEIIPDAKRGRGRPAIITLELVEQIARLIAKGMTEEQACTRAGVNHASLRTARHRNPEFETAIKEAQAAFLDESLDRIAAGSRGWQGRAWILERRHGEQFRRNTGLELGGHVGLYSAADLLMRKSLAHWSTADLEKSLGAWTVLRNWSLEQLEQLHARYGQEWGLSEDCTEEQLDWRIEVGRRINQLRAGDGEALTDTSEAEQPAHRGGTLDVALRRDAE